MFTPDQFARRLHSAETAIGQGLYQRLQEACKQRTMIPDDDDARFEAAQVEVSSLLAAIADRPSVTAELLAMKVRVMAQLTDDLGEPLAVFAREELRRATDQLDRLAWSIIADLALSVETGIEHEARHE